MRLYDVEVLRMNILEDKGNLKAFADVKLMDDLLVKGIAVKNGKNGDFVSFPRERGRDGKYYSTVLPLNKDSREHISRIILNEYIKRRESNERT